MSNQPTEKRRGRPAGSNSFERIKIADLLSLVGQNGSVPVSKVWLREMGVSLNAPTVQIQITPVAAPVEEEEKISFSFTTFDDEKDEE